jgi:hypothetical protein
MESDSEDDVYIFDDSVVDPSFSCSSSDSSSDDENEYIKPRKKYKDGKKIKSSLPVLSNEQASFSVEERKMQNKTSSSSAEH